MSGPSAARPLCSTSAVLSQMRLTSQSTMRFTARLTHQQSAGNVGKAPLGGVAVVLHLRIGALLLHARQFFRHLQQQQ